MLRACRCRGLHLGTPHALQLMHAEFYIYLDLCRAGHFEYVLAHSLQLTAFFHGKASINNRDLSFLHQLALKEGDTSTLLGSNSTLHYKKK